MRRRAAVAAAAAAAVLLGGCSSGSIYTNYREIEQLRLIQTVGFDGAGGGEGVNLTLSSGRGLDGEPALLLSCWGRTVREAMDRAQNYASSEKIFYAHTRYILIGEETAEAGLLPILSFLARSSQLRLSANLAVVREDSARTCMETAGTGDYDVTETLDSIRQDAVLRGVSQMRTVGALSRDLAERGAGLVCAVRPVDLEGTLLSQDSTSIPEASSGNQSQGQSSSSDSPADAAEQTAQQGLIPAGYGVVTEQGKVVAWLDGIAARGVNILSEQLGAATLTVDCDDYGTTALTATQCKTEVKPVFDGDGALEALEVQVLLEAVVTEMPAGNVRLDDAFTQAVQKQLACDVASWVYEPLELEQRLQADFLALGPRLARHAPRHITGPEWIGQLEDAQLRISVQARVERINTLEERLVQP
ncbi:MAG: hypothetical protein MR033_03825 [Clostridiales bacterium]|nr:hypothetical protein [Clostridiales bacterium]